MHDWCCWPWCTIADHRFRDWTMVHHSRPWSIMFRQWTPPWCKFQGKWLLTILSMWTIVKSRGAILQNMVYHGLLLFAWISRTQGGAVGCFNVTGLVCMIERWLLMTFGGFGTCPFQSFIWFFIFQDASSICARRALWNLIKMYDFLLSSSSILHTAHNR